MSRLWNTGVIRGAVLVCGLACSLAHGAIRVDGYGACSARANSLQFPYTESHQATGGIYLSVSQAASVSGATASSEAWTASTPAPGRDLEWPTVCNIFHGNGSAQVSITEPNGQSAMAGSHVSLSFDVYAPTGATTFVTSGVGRITLMDSGNQLLVDCYGDNTIIAYLTTGHYELDALVDASTSMFVPSVRGTFDFTVPGPGVLSVISTVTSGAALALRRRR